MGTADLYSLTRAQKFLSLEGKGEGKSCSKDLLVCGHPEEIAVVLSCSGVPSCPTFLQSSIFKFLWGLIPRSCGETLSHLILTYPWNSPFRSWYLRLANEQWTTSGVVGYFPQKWGTSKLRSLCLLIQDNCALFCPKQTSCDPKCRK